MFGTARLTCPPHVEGQVEGGRHPEVEVEVHGPRPAGRPSRRRRRPGLAAPVRRLRRPRLGHQRPPRGQPRLRGPGLRRRPCRPGRGPHLRRRAPPGVHPADPRHPRGQGREGDLLPGRPGGGAPPRPGAPDRGRGPHHRQPHLEPRPPAARCPRSASPSRSTTPPRCWRRSPARTWSAPAPPTATPTPTTGRAPRRPRPGQHRVERRLTRLREARAAGPSSTTRLEGLQPGGIILLHDGGGNRDQTIAALPQLIDAIRGRGLSDRPRLRPASPTGRRATSTASRPTPPSRSTWWAGRRTPTAPTAPPCGSPSTAPSPTRVPANGTRGDGHPGIDVTLPVATRCAPRLPRRRERRPRQRPRPRLLRRDRARGALVRPPRPLPRPARQLRAVGGRASRRSRPRRSTSWSRSSSRRADRGGGSRSGYEAGGWSGWGMQCSSSSATVMRSRFSQVISLVGSLRTLYSRNDCSRLS